MGTPNVSRASDQSTPMPGSLLQAAEVVTNLHSQVLSPELKAKIMKLARSKAAGADDEDGETMGNYVGMTNNFLTRGELPSELMTPVAPVPTKAVNEVPAAVVAGLPSGNGTVTENHQTLDLSWLRIPDFSVQPLPPMQTVTFEFGEDLVLENNYHWVVEEEDILVLGWDTRYGGKPFIPPKNSKKTFGLRLSTDPPEQMACMNLGFIVKFGIFHLQVLVIVAPQALMS